MTMKRKRSQEICWLHPNRPIKMRRGRSLPAIRRRLIRQTKPKYQCMRYWWSSIDRYFTGVCLNHKISYAIWCIVERSRNFNFGLTWSMCLKVDSIDSNTASFPGFFRYGRRHPPCTPSSTSIQMLLMPPKRPMKNNHRLKRLCSLILLFMLLCVWKLMRCCIC